MVCKFLVASTDHLARAMQIKPRRQREIETGLDGNRLQRDVRFEPPTRTFAPLKPTDASAPRVAPVHQSACSRGIP